MIIHIEICDHCEKPSHGLPVLTYSITGENGVRHICGACQKKPFRRVEPLTKSRSLSDVMGICHAALWSMFALRGSV